MKEKFDRIHHIAIQVTNIEQSVKWYKKSFACNVSYQDNSWALIEFENTSLSLVLPSQHPPPFSLHWHLMQGWPYVPLVLHTLSLWAKHD